MRAFKFCVGLVLVLCAVRVSPADEFSEKIKEHKSAAASAADAAKEAASVVVPDDVLKTLDYREWPCWYTAVKGSPESKTVKGRVTKIYYTPSTISRPPKSGKRVVGGTKSNPQYAPTGPAVVVKPKKVYPLSFIVEDKEGKTTEINAGISSGAGSAPEAYRARYGLKSGEKESSPKTYIKLLFKKVYDK